MSKLNIAVTGCMGRMGQQLIKSTKSDKNLKLVTITENRIIKRRFSGLRPQLNSEEAFKKADVILSLIHI